MNGVFFRTDANRQIGSGHLHRCLILADALSERMSIQIAFLFSDTPKTMHSAVIQKNYRIFIKDFQIDELDFIHECKEQSSSGKIMLLIDSDKEIFYNVGFQKAIIKNHILLAHITFKHKEVFLSHLLHNQNILALDHQYNCPEHTIKLFGPAYTILKPQYKLLRQSGTHFNENVKNVLISFGGADTRNVSFKVLKALLELNLKTTIILVLGKLYDERQILTELITQYPQQKVEVFQNTPEMPELMYKADLAITSGGLTAWELACLGTPNVIISTSWRESATAEVLHQKELAVYLGHYDKHQAIGPTIFSLINDQEKRRKLYRNGLELVDALGTEKVVDQIEGLLN